MRRPIGNPKLRYALLAAPLFLLPACAGDPSAAEDEGGDESAEDGGDEGDEGSSEDGGEGGADSSVGSCDYTSPFSMGAECREWTGNGWTEDDVEAACAGLSGEVTLGELCSEEGMLGRCINDGGTDNEIRIVIYGDDDSACEPAATGCEVFGGGVWEPEPICGGTGGGGGDNAPFTQPTLECQDPIDGEPAGDGPDGQVCTWQLISGATEEGRHFEEYASCEAVYTQRPYYPVPPAMDEPAEDPRMNDSEYVEELDWVKSQIEASACVCCHSSDIAPDGASNWDIEAPGNWINTFHDSGLAFGAGWIDSSSFGVFPPEENNGFDRSEGIPTTDVERMVAFFENELAYRGRTEDEYQDTAPFGGPLYTQLIYEPEQCENGERVESDGTITWTGGPARYVYVLESGAGNPTVPPNLDLPDGTKWRIDVPWDGGTPIESGSIKYGELPNSMNQRFPIDGAPQELVPGNEYYLYVTADVIVPITRCLFTYEG